MKLMRPYRKAFFKQELEKILGGLFIAGGLPDKEKRMSLLGSWTSFENKLPQRI